MSRTRTPVALDHYNTAAGPGAAGTHTASLLPAAHTPAAEARQDQAAVAIQDHTTAPQGTAASLVVDLAAAPSLHLLRVGAEVSWGRTGVGVSRGSWVLGRLEGEKRRSWGCTRLGNLVVVQREVRRASSTLLGPQEVAGRSDDSHNSVEAQAYLSSVP